MEESVYKDAIQVFGITHQIDIAIEEMAELTQALCKYKRGLKHNADEEIADVSIVLEELKLIFNSHMIEEYKYSKVERLKGRIKEARESEL